MSERFRPQVAAVLAEAGWTPGGPPADEAEDAIGYVEQYEGRSGARSVSFPAAEGALREFAGLFVVQDGPGVDLRRKPFLLDPTQVAASADTLADFGAVLGRALFPIGMEGDHDSILAIAEDGHVFALDQAGEWHLGDTFDDALSTLVAGTQPPRVDSTGGW
jgi:SUKH-3 immunity protein of toxin-antitoxin system